MLSKADPNKSNPYVSIRTPLGVITSLPLDNEEIANFQSMSMAEKLVSVQIPTKECVVILRTDILNNSIIRFHNL